MAMCLPETEIIYKDVFHPFFVMEVSYVCETIHKYRNTVPRKVCIIMFKNQLTH